MVVRKASKVFKWEECGDYFHLRALKDLKPGVSIDWDIGVKPCPPNQPKRTLNVTRSHLNHGLTDTSGKILTRVRKGSVHFLTPNNAEEPQWTMETSPLIEVVMNPRENNDIDCSAYKNRSNQMKLLFLNMAPNTTVKVLGNFALRKFLRQHLHSLAERDIKIYLSVTPSVHLLEPPVPICYATDLVNKSVDKSLKPLGLNCSGCGKFLGTEAAHFRHIEKCNKFKESNAHLVLKGAQQDTASKDLNSSKSQGLANFNHDVTYVDSPISHNSESTAASEEGDPGAFTPAIDSNISDALDVPSGLNQDRIVSYAAPMSTTESQPVSIDEALEKLASAIGDTHPEFFTQTHDIINRADLPCETTSNESDTMDSNAETDNLSKENTPTTMPIVRSPPPLLVKTELEEEEDDDVIDRNRRIQEPELRRSSRAQKRKFESFTRLQNDKDWEAALERDRNKNKRLWSPVKVVGPRDIFKAPGLNKIAIFPDLDLKVEKVEPAEDAVEQVEPDELFQL